MTPAEAAIARFKQQIDAASRDHSAGLDALGTALEAAARREGPGRIGKEARWETTGPTTGELTFPRIGYYVQDGTPPHEIVPRHKKALAFPWQGKRVVVKRVHHPGTAANPWLTRAWHDPAVRAARAALTSGGGTVLRRRRWTAR